MEHAALLAEALQLSRDHDLVRPRVLPAQAVPRVELLPTTMGRGVSAGDLVLSCKKKEEQKEPLSEHQERCEVATHLVAARALVASFYLRTCEVCDGSGSGCMGESTNAHAVPMRSRHYVGRRAKRSIADGIKHAGRRDLTVPGKRLCARRRLESPLPSSSRVRCLLMAC